MMLPVSATRVLPFMIGLILSVNFVFCWAIPIAGMGILWKNIFSFALLKMFRALDGNETLREFAKKNIYTKPEHSDFFATSVLIIINSIIAISIVFYVQLKTGQLPVWLVFLYYCSWVGIGGRIMGGAYAMAHKEVVMTIDTTFFLIKNRI